MDQLYRKAIGMGQGKESAKLCSNELDYEFEKWKKEAVNTFVEHYPTDYKWQLEVTDWQSAMDSLADVYKKEKFKDDGKL